MEWVPVTARRRLRLGLAAAWLLAVASLLLAMGWGGSRPVEAATSTGYWLVGSDGGIFSFGDARFAGSTGALTLNKPIVGVAPTTSGKGYWLVASDGGIFAFGDAKFFGSTGAIKLNKPIVGMAPTTSGKGYWLVASDGGIFAFGDAKFFGSTGAISLAKPIVGMAPSPTGAGYWLVASDGGIFAFGDAKFAGSTGAIKLNNPIVGMAASPTGGGYWLVASDGGIFAFGDSKFFGSTGALKLNKPIVGLAAMPPPGDVTPPTVTANQASSQADPTNAGPINFTVVFSEAVTGFTSADVTVGGTAGGTKSASVTGSGTTYNVAVSGMATTGTVTVSVPAGVATDAAGNANAASTATDDRVAYDVTPPTVTANQASSQADPTNAGPINFTVVFSEAVTGFTSADVTVGGTAGGTKSASVTGSGTTYNVAVSGMATPDGTVTVSVPSGAASDAAGNSSAASTSTDNSVTYDPGSPSVTIDQADGQVDPAKNLPINFTVVFSSTVTGFTTGDVTITGSAGGTMTGTVTGSGTTYNVAVDGATSGGTVIASVPAGVATGGNGSPNTASTSADNTVTYDNGAPTVTINQAATQADPTNSTPINFTVVFSEPVTGFTDGDIELNGTAGASSSAVTGGPSTYNVAVTGMTNPGTVAATFQAGVASDAAANASAAPTSTDNTIDYDGTGPSAMVAQAEAQADPTNALPIKFAVTFTEPVDDFTSDDVTVGGTAGGTPTIGVSGAGTTYEVSIGGVTSSAPTGGTVTVSIPAGATHDALGNPSAASTGTDISVTYDTVVPTFDSIAAATGSTTVTATFSEPILCSTVDQMDFLATVNDSPVSVSAAGCNPTSDATIELTLASAPTGGASVVVSLVTGNSSATESVTDSAGNAASPAVQSTTAVTDVTVTVEQKIGQADPTSVSPIRFTVEFSEAVTDFDDAGDVVVGGTAGGTKTATITGTGANYEVAVTLTGGTTGTVMVTIPAGAATAGGDLSAASTSVDNVVSYDVSAPSVVVGQASSQADPTSVSPIRFTVEFSEAVTDFDDAGDVVVGGTAGGTKTATITGTGATYEVAVTLTGGTTGTVSVSIPAGAAKDLADNASSASTSADNEVTYDVTAPTFNSISASVGSAIITANFSEPILCSSVSGGDFLASIDGIPKAVTTAACSGTADQTIDLTLAGGVGEGQTVQVSLTSAVSGSPSVTDVAGNMVTGTPVTRQSPTIAITSGTAEGATVLRNQLMYTVTASGAITMTVDGQAPSSSDFTCDATMTTCTYDPLETSTTPLLPGEHTFVFTATDSQGDITTVTRTATVI